MSDDVLFADLPEHQRALVATSRANIPAAPRELPPRLIAGEGSHAAQKRIGVVVSAGFALFTLVFAYVASAPWLVIFTLLFGAIAMRLHFDRWLRARKLAWVRNGAGAVARVTAIDEIVTQDVNADPDTPRAWRVSYRYVLDGKESGDAQQIGAEEKALLERAGVVPIIVDRASTRTALYFSALDLR